jgi:hypothetical protein
MRTNNVKISMEISVPINNVDENGVVYLEGSFERACENASGQPIEIINNDGSSTVVGIAQQVKYVKDQENGDYILVDGMIYHGGTSEQVSIDKRMVSDVRLTSFGITQ